ncbi:hypothetical protein AAFF_G00253450 [Aldrovandia affinis]|uniref:Uncharacterized protein n=1 Tax=Aldrovandia affinis TaxID=143900 RepID=A0AAD7STW2_9TELE|nr:hypothetical protein AAFF_G00253450 [Aldrovandia affinis]
MVAGPARRSTRGQNAELCGRRFWRVGHSLHRRRWGRCPRCGVVTTSLNGRRRIWAFVRNVVCLPHGFERLATWRQFGNRTRTWRAGALCWPHGNITRTWRSGALCWSHSSRTRTWRSGAPCWPHDNRTKTWKSGAFCWPFPVTAGTSEVMKGYHLQKHHFIDEGNIPNIESLAHTMHISY